MPYMRGLVALTTLVVCFTPLIAQENPTTPNPVLQIRRASGPITVDGDLSDAAWQNVTRIEQWWETNPGDNVEPKVKSVGMLAYDDKFFYAAFEFQDTEPNKITRALNDRDNISGNTDDYAGVIIDARNTGRTAILFLSTPSGIQYDAVSDDSSGEDSSPDFHWDSAGKITATGWNLEIRIPFSTLRYEQKDPQEWGILLYRNWPRERRYQMFANRIPRGQNCFICNQNKLVGLQGLPPGGNLIAAPYLTAREVGRLQDDGRFVNRPIGANAGLDVKWTPNANTAVDATLNPDFSQVESDVAVISTNERFAINYPEKRPFFLEGVELFSTPIQALYTRTITSPRWGLRSTGKLGDNAYTLLIAQDRGGGSVILPTPFGSNFADQDFESTVAVGRMRREFGKSFISFLGSTREVAGGGHNRLFGPDFQWVGENDKLTGQILFSSTETPNRPLLAEEWTGEKLTSRAMHFWYSHSTRTNDAFVEYRDFGDDFRADNGFVPQVGFRSGFYEVGHTFWPKEKFFSRFRVYNFGQYDTDQKGEELYRLVSAGFGADGSARSFWRFRLAHEQFLVGDEYLTRNQLVYNLEFAASRLIPRLFITGFVGEDIDFTNGREGRGTSVQFGGNIRPTNHLDLQLTNSLRWLSVSSDRLFTSQVERIRATYTFNSRMFIRTILQNQRTNFDRALYGEVDVPQHSGAFATQLLFAYKLNWQTLVYVGMGDLRQVGPEDGDLEPSERQFFLKVSYAFQR